MKLLTITVQDGDNQYDEYLKVNNEEEAENLKEHCYDGFERAIKKINVMDMTEEEQQILEKFGVI